MHYTSYAIWNNKGGVGKSFLSFVLATEYAKKHEDKIVCVIDVCPQANVSEILLGGGLGDGRLGYSNLARLLEHDNRETIGGYFDKRLSNPDTKTGSETHYAINVHQQTKDDKRPSEHLPANLWLVCGDPSLELQVQSVNQLASIGLPENRWANIHKWIKDLQDGISEKHNKEIVYFIDCNPSFATYTAQAVLAADRLLVPCTADGSSARAIDNIGQLLHGFKVSPAYSKTVLSAKAQQFELAIPEIFLILFNRHTTSDKKPTKAFKAMYEEIAKRVYGLNEQAKKLGKDIFSKADWINNKADWINKEKTNYMENMGAICQNIPDAHAVAIVASEKAIPISQLKAGSYTLQHGSTQINDPPLGDYQKAIKGVVELL